MLLLHTLPIFLLRILLLQKLNSQVIVLGTPSSLLYYTASTVLECRTALSHS